MNIDIQIAVEAFQAKLQTIIEQRTLSSSTLRIVGVRALPFDLPSPSLEPGVIDHLRMRAVNIEHNRMADDDAATVNTPPGAFDTLTIEPLFLEPNTDTIMVTPIWARCVFDLVCIRLEDLKNNGVNDSSAGQWVTFHARINFKLAQPVLEAGTRIRLPLELQSIEFGRDPVYPDPATFGDAAREEIALLTDAIRAETERSLPPIEFPLSSILAQVGDEQRVWNTGISLRDDCLTVRLQVERAHLIESPFSPVGQRWFYEWRQFHASGVSSRLSTNHWGVFLPRQLFERRVYETINEVFTGEPRPGLPASWIADGGQPVSTWSVSGVSTLTSAMACHPEGQARIDTRFAIRVDEACRTWLMDMNVNIEMELLISLPAPGTLRFDVSFRHEVDVGEAMVCTFLNAALGSVVGGFVGPLIGTVLGTLAGGIASLAVAYTYPAPDISTGELRAVEGVDDAYYQEISLGGPINTPLGQLTLTQLIPCDDGLMAAGTWRESTNQHGRMGTVVLPTAYRWVPATSGCPAPGATPVLKAQALLQWPGGSGGDFTLRLWGTQVIASRPATYSVTLRPLVEPTRVYLYIEHTRAQLQSLRAWAQTEEVEAPEFMVLLQSNLGARLVKVPGPAADLTEADRGHEVARIVARCRALEDLIESFGERAGRFVDMLREPEQVPRLDRYSHRWSLTVAGLADRQLVVLGEIDGTGNFQRHQSIRPDERGLVRRRLVHWGDPSALALTIATSPVKPVGQTTASTHESKDRPRPRVGISVQHFERMGTIAPRGKYLDHQLSEEDGTSYLAVLTSEWLTRFRLGSPQPELVSVVPNEGLTSLEDFPDEQHAPQQRPPRQSDRRGMHRTRGGKPAAGTSAHQVQQPITAEEPQKHFVGAGTDFDETPYREAGALATVFNPHARVIEIMQRVG